MINIYCVCSLINSRTVRLSLDGIKSKALSIKQKINKISYRKSKSSNSDIAKDHFNYIVFLTNDKD